MRVTVPVQLQKQHQRNKSNEDAIATTTKMPQRFQHNKGDDASAMWATTPAQQRLAVAIPVVIVVIHFLFKSVRIKL
jgi:hypothetical protein